MDRTMVVTGAAGLVGQNLALVLRENGYTDFTCIDKHADNLRLLAQINPGVNAIKADLASDDVRNQLTGADCVIVLHAQITSKTSAPFIRNNIDASRRV